MSNNYTRDQQFYDILAGEQLYGFITHRCSPYGIEQKCILYLEDDSSDMWLPANGCPINHGSKVRASVRCLTCTEFDHRNSSLRCYDCDFCENKDEFGQLL